jgi:hypothetical protein
MTLDDLITQAAAARANGQPGNSQVLLFTPPSRRRGTRVWTLSALLPGVVGAQYASNLVLEGAEMMPPGRSPEVRLPAGLPNQSPPASMH